MRSALLIALTLTAVACEVRQHAVGGGAVSDGSFGDRQDGPLPSLDGSLSQATEVAVDVPLVSDRPGEVPRSTDGADSIGSTSVCGNAVVEAGETCDPVSACIAAQTACASTKDLVRTPKGAPSRCTFVCSEVPRPCGPGDGHCPTDCAAGMDPDCGKPTGQNCQAPADCATGYCVSGFCCDSPCAGTCFACAAAYTGSANGSCAPVRAGMDPANQCTRASDSSCGNDGDCDGSGNCRKFDSKTVCQAETCAAGTATALRKCTGSGSCGPPASSTPCGAYACGPSSCKTSCTTDADCISSYFCDAPSTGTPPFFCKPRCQSQSSGNLLSDGGFDGGTCTCSTSWDPEDGVGCAGSGSGKGVGIDLGCFGNVVPGTTYYFGFMKKQAAAGLNGFCALGFYPEAGCRGSVIVGGGVDVVRPSGWTREDTRIVAGQGAVTGKVTCVGTSPDTLFDRVYVNTAGPVF